MARPEKPNMPTYKTMQVTEQNHKELTALLPYGSSMREWFNDQLTAFIEFKKHTDKIAAG